MDILRLNYKINQKMITNRQTVEIKNVFDSLLVANINYINHYLTSKFFSLKDPPTHF